MRPPEVALLMLLGGLLIAYIEFLRPGWVIPGAIGGVVFLLGVARLWDLPAGAATLLLWAAAMLCISGGVLTRQVALGCVLSMVLLLVAGREIGARWWVSASLVLPFVSITGWLLEIAWRARWNKLSV